MPEIQIDWYSQEELERFRDLRDRHGMVWRGVLLAGAKHVESIDLLQALVELHPALAKPLPGEHDAIGRERTAVRDHLRAELTERQLAHSPTPLPESAFTDAPQTGGDESVPDSEPDERVSDGPNPAGEDAGLDESSSLEKDAGTPEATHGAIDVKAAVQQIKERRSRTQSEESDSNLPPKTRGQGYQRRGADAAREADRSDALSEPDAFDDVPETSSLLDDPDDWASGTSEMDPDSVDLRYDYGVYGEDDYNSEAGGER